MAIYIKNPKCGIVNIQEKENIIIIIIMEFSKFIIIGTYIFPSKTMEEFKKITNEIVNAVKLLKKETIVLGDFNAKSPQWGAPRTDARGDYWTECMAEVDMIACNDGSPTFVRNASETHIDITCATKKESKKITNWKTLEDEIASFHKAIYFEVENRNTGTGLFQKNIFNSQKFIENIKEKKKDCKTLAQLIELAAEGTKKATSRISRGRNIPDW